MRVFLEIFKERSDEEILKGLQPEHVVVDVSSMKDDEIVRLKEEIVSILKWDKCKAQKHICYHDEEEVRDCEIIEV